MWWRNCQGFRKLLMKLFYLIVFRSIMFCQSLNKRRHLVAKDSIPTKELNPLPWLTGALINLIKKKGNRMQETKTAPVGVTKSQI